MISGFFLAVAILIKTLINILRYFCTHNAVI